MIGRNELAAARKVPIDEPLNAEMLASLDMPERALATLRREYAATRAGNSARRRDMGIWAAHFGDPQLALEALRAAIAEQGVQSVFLWLPQLAPVRRLPEFKTFARDFGYVAYWQEYGWPPVCRPLDEDTIDFECR